VLIYLVRIIAAKFTVVISLTIMTRKIRVLVL